MDIGGKFLNKLWCCVDGEYNRDRGIVGCVVYVQKDDAPLLVGKW